MIKKRNEKNGSMPLMKKIIFSMIFFTILMLISCTKNEIKTDKNDNTVNNISETSDTKGSLDVGYLSGKEKGYRLKQVVVLSRHNVRSPISAKGSHLYEMTPHKWFDWTSNQSELSIRGGVLETEIGQYYRGWFEKEELFSENYNPKKIDVATDEVRIYANTKQRTLATANHFLTGLFPVSDLDVEHHMKYDEMDPVFNPVLTDIDDDYKDKATKQIYEMFTERIRSLKPNYDLIEEVVDVKDSKAYKEGKFIGLKIDDDEFILEEGKEPKVVGSLKTACELSDALTFQYYESSDEEASFGKNITYADWEKISEVKDTYEDVLFTAPLVATNVANPLLKEILSEIKNENRKFTFLCGHDSNVASVLAALNVKEYFLPYAIERKTPIGCKITISTWVKEDSNEEYISIDMIYQKVRQLRGIEMLGEKNPPAIYQLDFNGMNRNVDGYFKKADVIKMFEEAISKK